MKKNKILLTLLPLTLVAVGCDQVNSSSSSNSSNSSNYISSSSNPTSSSISTSTGSSDGLTTDSDWSIEDKTLMTSLLTTTIPFIKLASNYDVILSNDEDGDFICVADVSNSDLVTNIYGGILESSGFEFSNSHNQLGYNAYFYTKVLDENTTLVVQYDYFPGDEEYSAGNEIFAWLENTMVTPSDAWSNEFIELMEEHLGLVLPFVALDNPDYGYDSEYDEIYIYDFSTTNLLTNYGSLLEDNGFEFNFEDNGFSQYVKFFTETEAVVVEFGYQEETEEYYGGNAIYAYVGTTVEEEVEYLTAWLEEAKSLMLTHLKEELPFLENTFSTSTTIEYDEEYYCLFLMDENGTNENALNYENFLLESGYLYDEANESYIKNATEDGYQIRVELFAMEGLGFFVSAYYEMLPLVSDSFPTTYINEYFADEVNVPSYEASSYNYYIYQDAVFVEAIVAEDISLTYKTILESYNYTVTLQTIEELELSFYEAIDADSKYQVIFYYNSENSLFTMYVEPYVSEEPDPNPPVTSGTKFDIEGGSHLQEGYNESEAQWVLGNLSMTITKNTSTIAVGNTQSNGSSYFYGGDGNFRVYAGQMMTFAWEGDAPTSIVIEMKSSKNNADGFASATATNCSVAVDGLSATITIDQNSNSCSVVLSKQAQILSVEVVY